MAPPALCTADGSRAASSPSASSTSARTTPSSPMRRRRGLRRRPRGRRGRSGAPRAPAAARTTQKIVLLPSSLFLARACRTRRRAGRPPRRAAPTHSGGGARRAAAAPSLQRARLRRCLVHACASPPWSRALAHRPKAPEDRRPATNLCARRRARDKTFFSCGAVPGARCKELPLDRRRNDGGDADDVPDLPQPAPSHTLLI
mmetsp:Transcript_17110/g.57789  ORF Transcript_17110/g.57789 Transcript_17110/m.57789 type:complete len:202 (-) Transcript_17110:23-628(-)